MQSEKNESFLVLVADADEATRGSMVSALEHGGLVVDAAADGETAWAALLARRYDLLVTSDVMPKASGLALVRRIRVAVMALPVIVASDRLDAEDVARLSRDPWARFDAFIRKPVDLEELLAMAHKLLAIPEHACAPTYESSRRSSDPGIETGQ
jgi:CheY-like chemotaxis protein